MGILSKKFALIASAISLPLIGALLILAAPAASSLSGSQFQADRIIDDFVFYNGNSMTAAQIQEFLNAKVPTCDTNGTQNHTYRYNSSTGRVNFSGNDTEPADPWTTTTRAIYGQRYDAWYGVDNARAPYTCLKDHRQDHGAKSDSGVCAPVSAQSNQTAAQIIDTVARACNISQKALLVTLQKEQSLITDDWPWKVQYQKAMGYYCPDDPDNPGWCHPDYAGFFNQVYNAAKQFNRYKLFPQEFNHAVGRTSYVAYQANTPSCGGTNLTMQNAATAGLYNYTPYQPNGPALANLYGLGDGCSAYGNRNFWRMYNDWFGNTYADDTNVPHPDGTLVSDGSRVYVIENNALRHIVTPTVFTSYRFKWDQIIRASSGDKALALGTPLSEIAPGSVFRTEGGPVYVMDFENGQPVKRHVTYAAYTKLGYKWEEVMIIPASEVPTATHTSLLTEDSHPFGSIILNKAEGKVYFIDIASRRHVLNPTAFNSYNFNWSYVKESTPKDMELTVGPVLDIRRGTILHANGIYVIDYDANGSMKRPFGPWECYSQRLRYTPSNWSFVLLDHLPARTGPIFTC